jgi:hypothetical protein
VTPASRRIVLATFACVSLPFWALHLFNHPYGDDFGYASAAREMGFLEAQLRWYRSWTGRYTATALQSAGPLAAGWLPGYKLASFAAMLALLAALVGCARAAFASAGLSRGAGEAALLFFAVYLCQMPSPAEGLYWMAGWASYTLPAAGLLVAAGLYLRVLSTPRRRRRRLALLAGLCTLLAGGNETLLALLCLAAALLTLRACLRRRDLLAAHGLLLGVCLAAAAVVALAPGNAARRLPELDLGGALLASLGGGAARELEWTGLPLVAAALVAALAAARSPLPQGSALAAPASLAASLGVLLLFPLAGQLPAELALGSRPPPRAQNVLALFFQAAFLLLAAQLALRHKPRLLRLLRARPALPAAAAALLFASALFSQASLWAWRDLFVRAPGYDRELRAREARLAREHGDVVVPYAHRRTRPRTLFVGDVGPDPGHWANRDTARYFGAASIRMAPAPLAAGARHPRATPTVYWAGVGAAPARPRRRRRAVREAADPAGADRRRAHGGGRPGGGCGGHLLRGGRRGRHRLPGRLALGPALGPHDPGHPARRHHHRRARHRGRGGAGAPAGDAGAGDDAPAP